MSEILGERSAGSATCEMLVRWAGHESAAPRWELLSQLRRSSGFATLEQQFRSALDGAAAAARV